jgi:hypothetical protein
MPKQIFDADTADGVQSTFRRLLHSIPNARRILGDIGNTKIYEIIAEEKLEAVKLGGRTFITGESLDRLVASLPRANIRVGQNRNNAAPEVRRRRRPGDVVAGQSRRRVAVAEPPTGAKSAPELNASQ